jgi:hypothetical protein
MSDEHIINELTNSKDSRQIKYLALDLITGEYDPQILAQLAKQNNIETRLGYLSDVIIQAAENTEIDIQRIKQLSSLLYNTPQNWLFLDPNLPDFAKTILKESPQTALNSKWKIYSNLTPAEIKDWIDLYISKKYAASSRR